MSSRKQQLLTTALVLLVIASCLLEQATAKRSRGGSKKSHYSRSAKRVSIEIYHPKGIMIWYPYRSGMEFFGIEIFINKQNQELESGSEEVQRNCDICLNTTEVSYGKFVLRDDDAYIRSRDHLSYNAIFKKASGEPYVSRSNEFYVSESRIIEAGVTSTGERCNDSSAVVEAPSANVPNTDQKEVKLLEEILAELNQLCHATQNQTKHLLLNAQTPTRYDAKQLYRFVATELANKLPQVDWNRTLVDAYYSTSAIVFEVTTIVDKLKILKLAKKLPGQPIEDLDVLQTEDMSNDIESWINA